MKNKILNLGVLLFVTTLTAEASEFFTDTAKIYPGTPECSDDFSNIENCYNKENPQRPSIMRSLDRASSSGSADNSTVQAYPKINPKKFVGKTAILPWSRSTSDGRIRVHSEAGGITISLFEPQNYKHGLKLGDEHILSEQVILPNILHIDPNRASVDYISPEKVPQYWHLDVCHDRYLNEGITTRSCAAPIDFNSDEFVYGDCYDFTLLTKMSVPGNLNNFELRSVPLTVFIQNAKSANNDKSIHVYARTTGSVLPPVTITENWEIPKYKSLKELSDICSEVAIRDVKEAAPYYCKFLKDQSYSEKGFDMYAHWAKDWNENDYFHLPGGDKNGQTWQGYNIFEPTVSLDGRLLMMNSSNGIYYSFSQEPCRADKWIKFDPLSKIPIDPNIFENYGIGKSQRTADNKPIYFRDTQNNPILPPTRIEGAYLWLDRLGRNLFFAHVNSPRDNYLDTAGENRSRGPGMVNSVLGSWTQGKIVALDNTLTPGDISQNQGAENLYYYNFYQGEKIKVRPTGMFNQNSLENEQNFYEALSPTLPFDVVWRFSGDTQKNVEVTFDEYMMNNALIVAHMNAPVVLKYGNALIDDGFEPQDPSQAHNVRFGGKADFGFKSSPKIQNAATSSYKYSKEADSIPSFLKLYGGARVEPVALGGVIGKGLYLDGKNDFLKANFRKPQKHNQWLIGAWFDSRETNPNIFRQIFQFSDNSSISFSLKKLRAYDGIQSSQGEIDISRFGLVPNKYFHLSVIVKLQPRQKIRTVEFFINGTKAGSLAFRYTLNPGFSFNQAAARKSLVKQPLMVENSESFILGSQNGLPFKGWTDELRVYGLGLATDNQASDPLYGDHFWSEFNCNLAYGSMAKVSKDDLKSPNQNVQRLAILANKISPFIAKKSSSSEQLSSESPVDKIVYLCEQFQLESHNLPSDFSSQNETTVCAGKTHLNDPNDEDFQKYCMRPYYLRIHDKKLNPHQPRPDFAKTNFCLSCHHDGARVPGLKLEALSVHGSILKHADQRRQPLDLPGIIHGCVQEFGDNEGDDANERCKADKYSDLIFESGKIKPKD